MITLWDQIRTWLFLEKRYRFLSDRNTPDWLHLEIESLHRTSVGWNFILQTANLYTYFFEYAFPSEFFFFCLSQNIEKCQKRWNIFGKKMILSPVFRADENECQIEINRAKTLRLFFPQWYSGCHSEVFLRWFDRSCQYRVCWSAFFLLKSAITLIFLWKKSPTIFIHICATRDHRCKRAQNSCSSPTSFFFQSCFTACTPNVFTILVWIPFWSKQLL